MCPVGMSTFHQRKFSSCSFDYFFTIMIRPLVMNHWLRRNFGCKSEALFKSDSNLKYTFTQRKKQSLLKYSLVPPRSGMYSANFVGCMQIHLVITSRDI